MRLPHALRRTVLLRWLAGCGWLAYRVKELAFDLDLALRILALLSVLILHVCTVTC